MTDWRPRARALAASLETGDERWRRAFAEVPRHLFVPRFHRRHDDSLVSGELPDQHDEWFDAVYSDDSLTTQLARAPGSEIMVSTSSSSLPSLMARMLDLLDVTDTSEVLEIGTGTGYNAALLCHRLGDRRVISVELDPELVESAAVRLAQLGWSPCLKVGDGAAGVPERAPYDRLIATCAVPDIPTAWLDQLRPDALVVTEIRGEVVNTGSLIVLQVDGDGTASGQYLGRPGHFMWLRAQVDNPLRDGGEYRTVIDRSGAVEDTTTVDPAALEDPDFAFLLQRRQPAISRIWPDSRAALLLWDDGAWAEVDTTPVNGRYRVAQRADRAVWQAVEDTYELWEQHGRPSRERYGLTVTPSGQWTWLDTPDHHVT